MEIICILLRDNIAVQKPKSLLSKGQKLQQIQVLAGSLWTLDTESDGGPFYIKGARDASKLTLVLISLEKESTECTCQGSDISKLTYEQCELLKPISTCSERYKVFQDEPWMKEGVKITKGNVVFLINCNGIPERAVAVVRYKGPVTALPGTFFGVELSSENAGKGTSDGMYRKKQYFQCNQDCALFVHINKIRLCKDSRLFNANEPVNNRAVEHQEIYDHDVSPVESPPELAIGERVIWPDDDGTTHLATVHWIGILPDAVQKEYTVGVEFDDRIGTGTGKYKDKHLFKAQNGHASLIPVMGLIKAEEYYGGKDKIPQPDRSRRYQFAAPVAPPEEEPRRGQMMNPAIKPVVLDKDYYRESYKTNRHISDGPGSPKVSRREPQETSTYPGEAYDEFKGRMGKDEPLYAHVGEATVVTRGSRSEQIYSVPNKQKLSPRSHTDTMLSRASYHGNPLTSRGKHTVPVEVYNSPDMQHPVGGVGLLPLSREQSSPDQRWTSTSTLTSSTNSPTNERQGGSSNETSPTMQQQGPHGYNISGATLDSTRYGKTIVSPTEESLLKGKVRQLDPKDVASEFDLGSVVEVDGPMQCKYGVIRWFGYLSDKNKPIVGLEMEEEGPACTDGSFGGEKVFDCPSKKGFFLYLHKVKRDMRFEENEHYLRRTESQAFGSLACPDVEDDTAPPEEITDPVPYLGKNKGIQGHHNSCYLDATLFSMFAFTQTYDALLFRDKTPTDIEKYEDVRRVLKDGIVNPLRKNFFVRADKVLKLRTLLDQLSNMEGLMTEEKDPEEFLICLLQQVLHTEPYLHFSNGQSAFLYQLFVEKDEKISLPTTEQLLELSFLQNNMKLSHPPHCLILQMPRFGKDFKMYQRIVPSLSLDITDILEYGPRECHLCGQLATHECKDCFELNVLQSGLFKTAFCEQCLLVYHKHRIRSSHKSSHLEPHREYQEYLEQQKLQGDKMGDTAMPREIMELFAVICIETSHYVTFVKCGNHEKSPWVLFDSMADRMGAQHGYNIPEVRRCDFLPDMLLDLNKLLQQTQDKDQKDLGDLRRLLCDGYICMYRSKDLYMYT